MIERATGASLREALASLVFRPLGLREAVVAASLADARRLTPGYSRALDANGALHDVARRHHPGWVAHGVAIATAPDLAHLLDALVSGRVLEPESLAAMREAVPVPDAHPLFARPAYGLGLMIDLASPYGPVAGHAGADPGYSTAAFSFPDVAGRRLTCAVLANRDADDLALAIVVAIVTPMPTDSAPGRLAEPWSSRCRRPSVATAAVDCGTATG